MKEEEHEKETKKSGKKVRYSVKRGECEKGRKEKRISSSS